MAQSNQDKDFREHLRARKKETAAFFTRRPLNKTKNCRSLVQLARQGVEGRRQIGADGGNTGDDDDGDEGGNQAILDGGGARFIANETRDEIHFSLQL